MNRETCGASRDISNVSRKINLPGAQSWKGSINDRLTFFISGEVNLYETKRLDRDPDCITKNLDGTRQTHDMQVILLFSDEFALSQLRMLSVGIGSITCSALHSLMFSPKCDAIFLPDG